MSTMPYLPSPCFNLIKQFAGINPKKFFTGKIAKMIKNNKIYIKNFIYEPYGYGMTIEDQILNLRIHKRWGAWKGRSLVLYTKRHKRPSQRICRLTRGMYHLIDFDNNNWCFDLHKKTVKQLITICKQNKIKKYSKLKKADLVTLIINS
jgi:hypothetical protein